MGMSAKELSPNKKLLIVAGVFLAAYFIPWGSARILGATNEAFLMLGEYARQHVLLCLVPAMFIAGAITVFLNQQAVMRYLGPDASRLSAYGVASVSGAILAVCSCTVLPIFKGIYKKGAGIGPAVAFLYSGPAINILAIILTARILGFEMGLARVVGAVTFSVVIGVIMSLIYRKEEQEKRENQMNIALPPEKRPLWQTAFHFFTLIFILVFANWGAPESGDTTSAWFYIWSYKWGLTGFFALLLGFSLVFILKIKWQWVLLAALATAASAVIAGVFIEDARLAPLLPMLVGIASLSIITLKDKTDDDNREWTMATWDFTKQIMPLLAVGVLTAGFLLGSTHDGQTIPGIIPNEWITWLVGGNSFASNFFASVVGAFMYFATLTEIPILQGLIASGMGKGPALSLLLAGPALSLPNMLVIRGVMGTQKTLVYVGLVIVMATLSGLIFGALTGG